MKPTTSLKAAIVVVLLGSTASVGAQGYNAYSYGSPYAGNGYVPYASSGYNYGTTVAPQSYYQGLGYGSSGSDQSYATYPATSGYGYDAYGQQATIPSYSYGGTQQSTAPGYSYSGSLPAYGSATSGYGYYGGRQGYYPYYPSPSATTSPYAYYPPPVLRRRNWNDWEWSDLLKKDNGPLQNPLDNEGYWADPNFHPWRTGPFAYHKWKDHPMKNFPWGDFPGWGEGFFGNFGPDQWKGVTPWGNDVPFKWIDPSDPEESIAQMWEDALNTPNSMGRLPPGFTMPYISVPNPIDVENEFERNARNAPNEFRNMWSDQGAGFGAAPQTSRQKEAEQKAETAAGPVATAPGGQGEAPAQPAQQGE